MYKFGFLGRTGLVGLQDFFYSLRSIKSKKQILQNPSGCSGRATKRRRSSLELRSHLPNCRAALLPAQLSTIVLFHFVGYYQGVDYVAVEASPR
jgi:hypothetical protein